MQRFAGFFPSFKYNLLQTKIFKKFHKNMQTLCNKSIRTPEGCMNAAAT
jgi:hypothetical protein